ncbi:MAG: NAD(P)/FAD-dependent oxidoreductase [Clostridiaceae bacterium]|nr:NAD(P)/FAD-dependent oxidoreductase [Clostridiaceae bacterium]HNR03308.1 NAD(P)/FAD-dependent oxidoreductase [Bacillota bacterium]
MIYDVIVVGGGPAGMIAAGTAASKGKRTMLAEKNEKLGKKLFITGKGRCNVTNTADFDEFMKNIPKNSKFFFSSFSSFSNNDLILLLESLGLKTKVERGGRVFPESDKSNDVIKALERYLNRNMVDVRLNSKLLDIRQENGAVTGALFDSGRVVECSSIIICTGGLSYPNTGSTGDGYKIAVKAGHSIIEPRPSLVPLVSDDAFVKELQGLSLKNVAIKAYAGGKLLYEDFGEMLFTHYGLSGPIILSASFFISDYLRRKQEIRISIDLKPALSEEELDKRIIRDFEKNINKQFKNSLDQLLPQKLIPVVISRSGIDESKEVHQITKQERKDMAKLLKGFTVTVSGTRPIEEAIVTSGGINLKEINPRTMESKLLKGLHFAGEIIDLDAFTGGFNLQIAFSTGYAAGFFA